MTLHAEPDPSPYHVPVLCATAIDYLVTRPEGIYVDGTCGGGGHTLELLSRCGADARIVGIDRDADAIARCTEVLSRDRRVALLQSNYSQLRSVLDTLGIEQIDGVLLDLGVSSRQIDAAERGFSYQHAGALDMRMDRETKLNAMIILRTYDEETLAGLLQRYGEEPAARRIARAILRERDRAAIETTEQLRGLIEREVPERHRLKTLSRVFQALRIAVNDELAHLEQALGAARDSLRAGGRMVVISYHSLEDRLVKNFIRLEAATCVCPPRTPVCVCGKVARLRALTRRAAFPSAEEITRNPRARSARLRAAEKIA